MQDHDPSRRDSSRWPPWAIPALIGLIMVAGTAIGVAVIRVQGRLDALQNDVAQLRSDAAELGPRLTDVERRLADARLRIDRLAMPLCPTFYGRSLAGPDDDDLPADSKMVTSRQWRRLAGIARYLPSAACIDDLRADQETEGNQETDDNQETEDNQELEVVLSLDDGRTLEIDMRADSEVAEVELLVDFEALPSVVKRTAIAERCRPRKTEISVRQPVAPADIRRLMDGWSGRARDRFPEALRARTVVELECGRTFWDLELAPSGDVLRREDAPP